MVSHVVINAMEKIKGGKRTGVKGRQVSSFKLVGQKLPLRGLPAKMEG